MPKRLRVPAALLLLVILVVTAVPAGAQILDPGPDVIGLYADPVGNYPGICQTITQTTLYLMITHPSDASGLTSFECTFQWPSNLVLMGLSFFDAINVSPSPSLSLGYPTPRPVAGSAYTLGTVSALLLNATPGAARLVPQVPSGYFATYGTVGSSAPIAVRPPDWGGGLPGPDTSVILWVNHPEWCRYTVPTEIDAWAAVKALYR